MAREEDVVPETKTNFGAECKGNRNGAVAATVAAVAAAGTTIKGVVVAAATAPSAANERVLVGAMSPKLDDDADDILSMSLNKIDSPPPPRSISRTKGGGGGSNNSNSSSSGGVEDLVRRKSNALSKVQSKSDSPLDGASVGSVSSNSNSSSARKSSSTAAVSAEAAGTTSTGGAASSDIDGAAPADDLCSTDEVKVFKDEGDRDDEKMSVEHNLLEEKSSLIDFTENEGKIDKPQNPRYHVTAEEAAAVAAGHPSRSKIPLEDKRGEATLSSVLASHHAANPFNIGYPFMSPYPTYSNGDPISMPMANKIGIPPFFCYSTNSSEPSHSLSVATHHLTTPPPAHCGIPPYQLDAKGIAGLSGRGSSAAAAAALYAFGPNPHQYHPSPYAMLGADLSNNWHAPSVYSSVVAAAASAGFRNSSYPPPPHDFSSFRFSHLIPPQSSATAATVASIASSVANHGAHHGYVGQFPPQLAPSYSLAGLTTPSSQASLVNSGPKHSGSGAPSSKSNKYFPSISSLGVDQGSLQSPTGQSKNGGSGGGGESQHSRSKESKLMSFAGREMKSQKQQQQQAVDNTPIGLQGLSSSKVDVGADLSSSSSSGANRLNSALLYQPYDAISKELVGSGCHPGEKSNSMGGGGMLGSGGGGGLGSMMPDERSRDPSSGHTSRRSNADKKPHIKKPLNAFMLYMKDMRANVVAECTLKESAAINQILGRRWHSLSREEQSKYYEKARMERQLHMELYPGWSARDNYGYGSKKKKRKKDRGSPSDISSGNNMKKCRARYGLDQQNQWCKPCRRKKKCIKYMEMLMMSGGVGANGGGSLSGGTMSPDYSNEFDNHNDDDDDDDEDDDASGDDSDDHMDDMDDDLMPPSSNETGGGGTGAAPTGSGNNNSAAGLGNSNSNNASSNNAAATAAGGGASPFLMQGPTRGPNGGQEQGPEKIFGNPAAQACSVGAATIKQERTDYGKSAFEEQSPPPSSAMPMHPGGSVAAYNAMLVDHHLQQQQQQQHHHLQLHNSLLHHPYTGHLLNGGGGGGVVGLMGASPNGHGHGGGSSSANALSQSQQQHANATTTVGPHSQDDKHGLHMYPFQSKHQAAVCFPPSPAASSSSSLTAPLSNNPKMNSNHSLWMASSPMLMTPATLSGSDQSPQRQTPEDPKSKNGSSLYGDHGGHLGAVPSPQQHHHHHHHQNHQHAHPQQQQKKKKRRKKRKHSKAGVAGGGVGKNGGGGASGMSKSIQHILLKAIFEGNGGQVAHGDNEKVIEFIEHFFRTRHSNQRMRQLIAARLNSSSGDSNNGGSGSNRHRNSSRHSDSDGGETDTSSCGGSDDEEEMVGCPRSTSKLPFTISSIIG